MYVTSLNAEDNLHDLKDFCHQCLHHFTLVFYVKFSASIFTTLTAGSSLLSSNANVGPRSGSTTGCNLKKLDLLIFLDACPCDTN